MKNLNHVDISEQIREKLIKRFNLNKTFNIIIDIIKENIKEGFSWHLVE